VKLHMQRQILFDSILWHGLREDHSFVHFGVCNSFSKLMP
jgi:hypothetical protein